MLVLRVAPVLLLALVAADKKIELQDIEDDNLKSEKDKDLDKSDPRTETHPVSAPTLNALDFLKNGFMRYFESPQHHDPQLIQRPVQPQQTRYVQQYAVSEPPERPPSAPAPSPKPQYGPPGTQQAMVGYLSNVPMQIYLVPQYYSEPSEQAASHQPQAVQYTQQTSRGYPSAPEQVQQNYVEYPAYVAPTGKAYIQQYSPPVAYVTYAQPTAVPTQAAVPNPIVYQMPMVEYPTAIVAPPVAPKDYYPGRYTDTNAVDEHDEEDHPKYATQTEAPYVKPSAAEFPRYYNSRVPLREDYKHVQTSELPPPNPLFLKGPPSHLAHLPKALPMYRPLSKPIYAAGGNLISTAYSPRPAESYGAPFKRRPTSLLDSYIPSGVQVEYLKRGYSKDPLQVYEALSTGRQFTHNSVIPRHYERGFLPNQMYHTAGGGITYGHYKRTPKVEKVPHNLGLKSLS